MCTGLCSRTSFIQNLPYPASPPFPDSNNDHVTKPLFRFPYNEEKTQHTSWLLFVNWPIRKCFSCPAQTLFWIYGILSGISIPSCKKKKNRCEGAAGAHCSLRMYERKSEESSVQLVLRDRTRVSKLASKHLIRYATPPAHRCLLCPSLPYSITQL